MLPLKRILASFFLILWSLFVLASDLKGEFPSQLIQQSWGGRYGEIPLQLLFQKVSSSRGRALHALLLQFDSNATVVAANFYLVDQFSHSIGLFKLNPLGSDGAWVTRKYIEPSLYLNACDPKEIKLSTQDGDQLTQNIFGILSPMLIFKPSGAVKFLNLVPAASVENGIEILVDPYNEDTNAQESYLLQFSNFEETLVNSQKLQHRLLKNIQTSEVPDYWIMKGKRRDESDRSISEPSGIVFALQVDFKKGILVINPVLKERAGSAAKFFVFEEIRNEAAK